MEMNKEIFKAIIKDRLNPPMDTFSFGKAIELLRKGYKLTRQGWNGKGLYVSLISGHSMVVEHETLVIPEMLYIRKEGSYVINTWVPSITDTLALDWQIKK